MNKKYNYIFFSILTASMIILPLHALQKNEAANVKNVLNEKLSNGSLEEKEKTVWFRYNDAPLATIVNELATHLNINILLPSGAGALSTKVTFEFSYKISLKKAWQYVVTLLKISGFTIVPHVGFSSIVKNDANTNKEPLPLFVNTPTVSLPKTDLKIRYLRYLSNIQVPGGQSSGGSNPLETILKDILSADAQLIFEPQLNAMVLTDYSSNIKSVMEIVDELDSSTIVQDMQVLRLEYASASHVKALFDQLIGSPSAGGSPQPQVPNNSGFFAQTTKIIPINRSNSLVLLGKKDALVRIIKFIKNKIDIPIEEGKSILHIYDLKYLKADTFAETLKAIVQSSGGSGGSGGYGSGTGQSNNTGSQAKLYFEGVIIASETASPGSSSSGGGDGTVQQGAQGGNRLIIAALERDWIRIQKLIKELDQPSIQVAIQGLIVDLSTTKIKELKSQIRNHSDLFFKDVKAQSANIGSIYQETPAIGLQSNLLNSSSLGSPAVGNTIISVAESGTNGIWLLTQMLQNSTDTKILSQPYLITTNHKQVSFTDSSTRYIKGAIEATATDSTRRENFEAKNASVLLNILPTISENGIINLGVYTKVDQFSASATVEAEGGNTDNREIKTNANIGSGDILVIGGLSKTKTIISKTGTPFLEKIPFVKHLFSSKEQTIDKSELMIFLRAEIIYNTPQISNDFTRYKTNEALHHLGITNDQNENFSQLKDPITHWFFGEENKEIAKAINLYNNNIASDQEDSPLHDNNKNKIDAFGIEKSKLSIPQVQEQLAVPENNVDLQKKQSPEQLKKLSESDEEKQAEEELRKLFNWGNNQEIKNESIKQITTSKESIPLVKKSLVPQLKKSGPQAETTPESEEKKAQQKLQALFQNMENIDDILV